MNAPTRIHPTAPGRIGHPAVRPSPDSVECQFCKVSALIAFYNELHSLCCFMLALTVTGTLLYGAGLLLWVHLGKGS